MSLPKIKFPIYSTTLPVSKKKVQFRPFLAKEEKLLLMGQQSTDIEYIVDVVKQVVNNCIVTDIDVGTLPTTDVEYFFLKLRGKSIGETAEIWIKDPDDGKRYQLFVNLEDVEITKNKNKINTIDLGDGIGLVMRPPTLEVLKRSGAIFNGEANDNSEFRVLQETIESIFDSETVYDLKQETEEEINTFLEQLSPQNLRDMKAYFDNLPKLTLSVKYKNQAGDEKTLVLEGLPSFFQLG